MTEEGVMAGEAPAVINAQALAHERGQRLKKIDGLDRWLNTIVTGGLVAMLFADVGVSSLEQMFPNVSHGAIVAGYYLSLITIVFGGIGTVINKRGEHQDRVDEISKSIT